MLLVLALVFLVRTKVGYFPSKYNFSYKINPKHTFINNNLTGAMDIIESDVWGFFIAEKYLQIPKSILDDFLNRGYLYENVNIEHFILKKLFKSFLKTAKSSPKRIVFCPTYYCNLNCTYCFEKKINKIECYFDEEKLNHFFKFINDADYKFSSLELYGGEPLLDDNQAIVEKILFFAKKKNLNITIVTNGTTLDKYFNLLKDLKENIEMIQITLDGVQAVNDKRRKFTTGEGSFNLIINNISQLLKDGINTNVRVNIDNQNVGFVPDLYKYIENKGWLGYKNFDIKLALVRDHSKGESSFFPEKILEVLLKQYQKYPELEKQFGFLAFKQLRNIVSILNGSKNVLPKFINCETNLLELLIFCPDGLIYTCPESIGIKQHAIGQFYPEFLFFNSERNIWRTKNIFSIPDCRDCKFSLICGGGCTYSSLLVSNGENPACEKYEAVINTFFKFRGKSILKYYNLN